MIFSALTPQEEAAMASDRVNLIAPIIKATSLEQGVEVLTANPNAPEPKLPVVPILAGGLAFLLLM